MAKSSVAQALAGSVSSSYFLCGKLIDKGVLTHAEAAEVFVKTANQIRNVSEDEAPVAAGIGESFARIYEDYAARLLQWRVPPVET